MYSFRIQRQVCGVFMLALSFLLHKDCRAATDGKKMAESPVGLYTAYTLGSFKKDLVLTTRYNQLIFEAQSCKERTLLLGNGTSNPRLLVVLAGPNATNITSYIKWVNMSERAVQNDSAPLLCCKDRVPLWLTWSQTSVSVGQGLQPGRGTVLQYTGQLGPMSTVTMGNPDSSWGEWRFPAQQLQQFYFSTHEYRYYQVDIGFYGRYYVKFSVKVTSLGAAHIALARSYQKTERYEVVIGGGNNTWCSVRKGLKNTPNKAQKSSVGVLSATEYRPFWVSWTNSTIAAGQGEIVGRQELVSWTDPEPSDVRVVSLASSDEVSGYWVLETPVILAPEYCYVSHKQDTAVMLELGLAHVNTTNKFQTLITGESKEAQKYLPFVSRGPSKQLTIFGLTPGMRYTFSTWGVEGTIQGDACTCKTHTNLGKISDLKLAVHNATFVSVNFTEAPGKKDGYIISCTPLGMGNSTWAYIQTNNCSSQADCYCAQLQSNLTYIISVSTVRQGFESQRSNSTLVANLSYYIHREPGNNFNVPLGTVIGGIIGAVLFCALAFIIVAVSKKRKDGPFRGPFIRRPLCLSRSGSRAELVFSDGSDVSLGNQAS